MLKSAINIAIKMIPIPLERKLITLLPMIICQMCIYGEEVSNRNTIIAFAQNTSHYLSLPEYWSSLNTEHHPSLKCREFSMILMFPVTKLLLIFKDSIQTAWSHFLQN